MVKIENKKHNTKRIPFCFVVNPNSVKNDPINGHLSIPFIQRKNAASTNRPSSCSDADISCYCRFDPEKIRTEKKMKF